MGKRGEVAESVVRERPAPQGPSPSASARALRCGRARRRRAGAARRSIAAQRPARGSCASSHW
eukprot:5344485-Pleurochrysis_carterae.AAC.9